MVISKKTETLHIYHTNDVHSHFENWPGIHEFLIQKREEHERENEPVFVFDVGDFIDRSHSFTEATAGRGNTELLNLAGYDAVTIGNNEGITLAKKDLLHLYEDAQFDVIVANLVDEDGCSLDWAVPYKHYITSSGLTVTVIAATAVYEAFYNKLGWTIQDPLPILKELSVRLGETADVIVCLSHLGIHEDRKLAEYSSSIDVILGAHTHHLFIQGELVESTLLAATGKYGQYVGHVCLTIENQTIRKKNASVIPASQLRASPQTEKMIGDILEHDEAKLDTEVFQLPYPLKQNLFGQSRLSDFFGDALLAYTKADCGLFNSGIFLGSLPKGSVTRRDLHRVLPHPINACVVTVTGEALYEYYKISLDPDWARTEVRGLGFRGTLMGEMIHVNLSMKDGILFIGETEVNRRSSYSLATLDMFTFGYFFPAMKSEKIDYIVPELIRDIAGWYGKEIEHRIGE